MKLPKFISSNDICESIGFTKRTLQRRFTDKKNPLPRPCIERVGAEHRWEISIALAWIERELNTDRSKKKKPHADEGDSDE